MAKSLLEGMEMGPGGARAKSPSKKNEGTKLIFAVALFVIAGVVFAWFQGWIFPSANKGPQISAEEQAQQNEALKEQQKATEIKVKTGAAKVGGTS